MLVFVLVASLGIAPGAHALESKTALRQNFLSSAERVGDFGSQGCERLQQNLTVATIVASECCDAARGVTTPYGVAVQEATPAAQAVLQETQAGAQLYRHGSFGVQQTTGAQFWSPRNPLSTSGYANQFGTPGSAAPDWVMAGTLKPGAEVITRAAPGLGTNAGGAIEAVTTPSGVGSLWFHMP